MNPTLADSAPSRTVAFANTSPKLEKLAPLTVAVHTPTCDDCENAVHEAPLAVAPDTDRVGVPDDVLTTTLPAASNTKNFNESTLSSPAANNGS